MRLGTSVLGFMLAATGAAAQEGDRLQTAECRRAVAALDAAEGDMPAPAAPGPAASAPPAARLEELRRAAARACLGGSGSAPPSLRSPTVPIGVAPIPAPRLALPPALPVPPPVRLPPPDVPTLVVSCNELGCWTSDGSFRARAAPGLLFGPRGPCHVQGVVLVCP